VAAGALSANDADRAAAREAQAELNLAANEHLDEVAARNRVFHMALVRPGGRLLTTQLIERLQILSERYVHKHLEPAGREDRAHLEHAGLMTAWLSADADRARALSRAHIEGTLTDLRRQLLG
jgi:DNA-binding GntR family transcriptional regulator